MVDKQRNHDTYCHKQQCCTEYGIEAADNLVNGEQSGQQIIDKDDGNPGVDTHSAAGKTDKDIGRL